MCLLLLLTTSTTGELRRWRKVSLLSDVSLMPFNTICCSRVMLRNSSPNVMLTFRRSKLRFGRSSAAEMTFKLFPAMSSCLRRVSEANMFNKI